MAGSDHGKMTLWLKITLLVLNLANSLLHGVGIYLLVTLFPQSRFKIQQRYLIHLSVCEFTINTLEVINILNGFVEYSPDAQSKVDEVFHYVLIIQFTGVSLVFYLDMIYLTLDRLFEIVLNIKYPVYWSEEKARNLLIVTWVVSGLITVAFCIAHGLLEWAWEPVIFTYFFPTMEFLFVFLAITTYIFIFRKYKITRISPAPNLEILKLSPKTRKRRRSSFYIFRRSKFFIPVLLILTFLIFMVGADLTLLFVGVIQGNDSLELRTAVFISYAISNLFDAWIYIFLQKDVKRLLYRKLGLVSASNQNTAETSFQLPPGKRYSVNFPSVYSGSRVNSTPVASPVASPVMGDKVSKRLNVNRLEVPS